MTPKNFTGLAVAAAVSVAVAGMLYSSKNRWSQSTVTGAAVMPTLAARANDVATVQLVQGETTLTIQKQGDGWNLKERDGYKVLPDKVRALIVQLANAQLVERKTQSAQRHATLELEDPVGKDAKSRMVRLLDASGRAVGEIIAGKQRPEAFGSGKPGVYVRRPSEVQTWLAAGPLDASLAVRDWVERNAFETDSAKISSLEWTPFGATAKESLKITRAAAKDGKDGALEIDGVPAGKKLKSGESADNVVRFYSSVTLDDVRKAVAADKDAKTGRAKLVTADGVTIAYEAHKTGDTTWVSLTASGEGPAKAAADAINARVKGWQFSIAAGHSESMFKTADQLFEANDAKG